MNVSDSQTYGSLLSFDAREMCVPSEQEWDTCRLDVALIKSDIVKPLSVDNAVWKRVIDVANPQSQNSILVEKAVPQWIGSHIDLWSNLSDLQTFCAEVDGLLPKPYWIIAISIMEDLDLLNYLRSKADFESLIHLNEAQPSQINDQWEFLGFDVADAGRLSGLTNCFYTEIEKTYSTKTFEPSLNQFHLFEDIEQANNFRLYSNQRVKEHSPFFIYGLFKITCGFIRSNQ